MERREGIENEVNDPKNRELLQRMVGPVNSVAQNENVMSPVLLTGIGPLLEDDANGSMDSCPFPPGFDTPEDSQIRHDNPTEHLNPSVTKEIVDEGEKTLSFVVKTVEEQTEVIETRRVCEDRGGSSSLAKMMIYC
ncbi:hypothetical protein PIB30_033245 [Stylosanthes scabra]|uniref:Uncharacterized protein n=1 Tax=Stylosanthes scabra TaxID=79078 RepID=A0ABU6WFX6_9FABA|nr:hypothetical protein [Stylosanthes scabra]